jgi:hypothetical protein
MSAVGKVDSLVEGTKKSKSEVDNFSVTKDIDVQMPPKSGLEKQLSQTNDFLLATIINTCKLLLLLLFIIGNCQKFFITQSGSTLV